MNGFKNSNNNIKEIITHFKDKNYKSKKKDKKYKMLSALLKFFDTIVSFPTKSSSITLSLTGISLIALPISICIACGLTITNKVL